MSDVSFFASHIRHSMFNVRRSTFVSFLYLLCLPLQAANINVENQTEVQPVATSLSYTDALLLGLVEGITEYLPISSTGHLIITNRLLGLDGSTPAKDQNGQLIFKKETRVESSNRAYTIGEAAYAYAIVIQAGAIAAVCLLYWRTLLKILLGIFGKNTGGRKLTLNLLAAFIPAAILGLLLDDWIETTLGDNVIAVAGALIFGAGAMLGVEYWRKRNIHKSSNTDYNQSLEKLTLGQSMMIGCLQCLALWPGMSRSMTTIIGGYIARLSPACAAEFSFLLGLITLSAASGYKFASDGSEMLAALQPGPVIAGFLIAFASAALAIKWLVGYLNKHGLAVFAWYRIALAVAIFALMK